MHTLSGELGLWLLFSMLKKRFLPRIPHCEPGLAWGPALCYLLKELSHWLARSQGIPRSGILCPYLHIEGLGEDHCAYLKFPECMVLIFSPVIISS